MDDQLPILISKGITYSVSLSKPVNLKMLAARSVDAVFQYSKNQPFLVTRFYNPDCTFYFRHTYKCRLDVDFPNGLDSVSLDALDARIEIQCYRLNEILNKIDPECEILEVQKNLKILAGSLNSVSIWDNNDLKTVTLQVFQTGDFRVFCSASAISDMSNVFILLKAVMSFTAPNPLLSTKSHENIKSATIKVHQDYLSDQTKTKINNVKRNYQSNKNKQIHIEISKKNALSQVNEDPPVQPNIKRRKWGIR